MIDAGCSVAGVDLSGRNVALARARGIDARQAELHALPFADRTYEAAWSMSVLLHLTDDEVGAALAELRRVLVTGAPVAIGLWGGTDFAGVNEHDRIEPKRWFRYRTHEHVRSLLEPHLTIERFDVWPDVYGLDLEYQWVLGRS
jgi:SAM-dependent methyltransferase